MKPAYFIPKWNYYIQVDILISCPTLSRVLNNSIKNTEKEDILVKVYD